MQMMKKILIVAMFLLVGASPGAAQQAAGGKKADATGAGSSEAEIEGRIGLGYRDITQNGSTIAGEYEYLKSSAIGALDLEYDPLPQRFVFESYYLNRKDYFGEMDYSYRDVVVLNAYTRGVFHNLNHYSFGLDDTATLDPKFTDLNPGDLYNIENALSRAFIRFKTPDFPFHLYADTRFIERDGTVQQRFLRGVGDIDKVSQSRTIDWKTREVRVGANSHLGPIEAEYSHTEKKFEAAGDKVLYDYSLPTPVPHNLVPDIKSSSDTVKVHTTYSGKVVLAGTYGNGDSKNDDSGAGVKFKNLGGDLTIMPVTSVLLALKYRHYDIDTTNPATASSVNATGTTIVDVRDSLSSSRDAVTGTIRYRATDRLTFKGEYVTDRIDRTRGTLGSSLSTGLTTTGPAFWLLPESTTKNTARLGLTYYVMKKVTFRADYSQTAVTNPAYETDPDKAHSARAWFTWMPTPGLSTLLSYGIVRETRDQLGAPLGGGTRSASRDQGLASVTLMVGDRSSITASYSYYKNKVEQTVTYEEGSGALALESGVPYDDIAHMGSLTLTVAPSDGVNLVASASRSYSRGSFLIAGAGAATNTSGIAELSDMKVIDTVYGAGLEMQHSRNVGSEVRYQFRRYDDQIDDTQDGTVKTILATVSMKW